MKNDKGFYDMHQPMSKTQPPKVPVRPCTDNGDGHDFNEKAKVTNPGGSYADSGTGGGFNGAEKDASIAYLTERGKKGQVVNQFKGTERTSREHTQNVGLTAYNSRPIDEVYKPGTSRDVPPVPAIVHPYQKKSELKG